MLIVTEMEVAIITRTRRHLWETDAALAIEAPLLEVEFDLADVRLLDILRLTVIASYSSGNGKAIMKREIAVVVVILIDEGYLVVHNVSKADPLVRGIAHNGQYCTDTEHRSYEGAIPLLPTRQEEQEWTWVNV